MSQTVEKRVNSPPYFNDSDPLKLRAGRRAHLRRRGSLRTHLQLRVGQRHVHASHRRRGADTRATCITTTATRHRRERHCRHCDGREIGANAPVHMTCHDVHASTKSHSQHSRGFVAAERTSWRRLTILVAHNTREIASVFTRKTHCIEVCSSIAIGCYRALSAADFHAHHCQMDPRYFRCGSTRCSRRSNALRFGLHSCRYPPPARSSFRRSDAGIKA